MKTSISSVVDGVEVFCMYSTVMLLVDIKVFSSIRTGGEGLKKNSLYSNFLSRCSASMLPTALLSNMFDRKLYLILICGIGR